MRINIVFTLASILAVLPIKLIISVLSNDHNIFVSLSLALVSSFTLFINTILYNKDTPKPLYFVLHFIFAFGLCHSVSMLNTISILSIIHVKLVALLGLAGISLSFFNIHTIGGPFNFFSENGGNNGVNGGNNGVNGGNNGVNGVSSVGNILVTQSERNIFNQSISVLRNSINTFMHTRTLRNRFQLLEGSEYMTSVLTSRMESAKDQVVQDLNSVSVSSGRATFRHFQTSLQTGDSHDLERARAILNGPFQNLLDTA